MPGIAFKRIHLKFAVPAAILLVAIASIFLFSHFANAAARTWTGGAGDFKFSTAGNWSGGVVPTNGDSLIFNVTGVTTSQTLNNDISNLSLTGLTITGASLNCIGYTINGNALNVSGSFTSPATAVCGGTTYPLVPSIDISMTLTGDTTFGKMRVAYSGGLTVDTQGHAITFDGDVGATCSAIGSLLGSGPITINGGTSGSGITTGSYVSLMNNSTYTGDISIQSGIVIGQAATILGTTAGSTTISGTGSLLLYAIANTTMAEPLNLSGTGELSLEHSTASGCAGDGTPMGPYTDTWTGPITLGSNFLYEGEHHNLTVTGNYISNGYSFTATPGDFGTSTGTISLPAQNPPGAPTGLSATPSSGQIAMSWTAPTDIGGGNITDYLVEYKLSSDSSWTTFSHSASTTPNITVTGLTNGRTYDVRVSAVNFVGPGSPTTASNLAMPAAVADAPTGLIATPGNSQAALSWTAPVNNGNASITDYTVEYKLSADSSWTAFSHSASTATARTVTGLANGSTYDFRVSAVNSVGTGSPVTVTNITLAATVPGVPTGLGGTPSVHQVALSWTAPASTGGAPITDYTVEYKLSSGSTWIPFAHSASTATSRTVTGLSSGTNYDFRVSAVNSAGTGSPVTTSNITVPTTTPDSPTALNAAPSDSQVALSWTAPADTGGTAVTDYTVEYKLSADSTWIPVSHSASATPARTVTGLVNGSTYDFRVSTVNSVGSSSPVSTTNVLVPAVIPGSPTGLAATPSGTQIALSWTAPSNNGGATITDYTVEYKVSTDSSWTVFSHVASATTSRTVTGLSRGVTYDLRVSTVNSAGSSTPTVASNVTVPAVVASIPLNLIATPAIGQIALDWDASADDGGAVISDYTVEYKLSSDSSWTVFAHTASTTTARTVTGLANGSSYDLRVSAVNSVGTGTPAVVTGIMVAASVAGAPINLIGSPSSTQVALSWNAPTSNGGAAITDYLVEYKLSTDSSWTTFSHSASTATARTVTGLSNGNNYDFRVSAVNSVGTGTPVVITGIAVAAAPVAPSAPTALEATVNEDHQIVLDWTAPSSDGGSAITNYTVEYKLSGSSSWTTAGQTGPGTTQYVFTSGITTSGDYDFRVTALNAIGSSPSDTVTNYGYVAPGTGDPGDGNTGPGAPNTGAQTLLSNGLGVMVLGLIAVGVLIFAIKRQMKGSKSNNSSR